MKKISFVLLLFVVFNVSTIGYAAGRVNLTIESVQEIAVRNSSQAQIDDLNIFVNELILKDSKYDLIPASGTPMDNAYKRGVDPIVVEMNLEIAKRQKDQNLESVRIEALKRAYDIILLKKEYNLENTRFNILTENLNVMEARFKIGTVTESDVVDAKYKLEDKKLNMFIVEQKLESAKSSLKNLLNYDSDLDIDISGDIEYVPLGEIDIDKILEAAIKKDINVYRNEKEAEKSRKAFEIVSEYQIPDSISYQKAVYNLTVAESNLADTISNVEMNIRNKLNDLMNLEGKTVLAIKNFEMNKRKYDNMLQKYNMGLISKSNLQASHEAYENAVYQKYTAICNYLIAKAEFESLI